MKIVFTNEFNPNVLDSSFFQTLFNRLVILQEQKESEDALPKS
ncbi:MAG: hypothetical protein ACI4R8_02820 [Candidatus Caccovivens sp.]